MHTKLPAAATALTNAADARCFGFANDGHRAENESLRRRTGIKIAGEEARG
ncbi:hypothetical protein FBZ96_111124 [Bradyrhizobium stylosanthis]|uniref:Uncharacterized protein n=1 Tax=Bradyrhizobium stylosanthis TaxID=1803665 RepID=A0A560D5H7_9BRAD|nr:hypothetical protein FBZ96_111124 [Bradyrhizobium stylosanthis]